MAKQIKLTAEEKRELGSDVVDMWTSDNVDRQEWLRNLPAWLLAYTPKEETKDVPWPDASNVHVPLTRSHVDTVHPKIMASLTRPSPIVGLRPMEKSDEPKAKRVEKFLDWAAREDVELLQVLDRTVLATCLYGVQFVKLTWELTARSYREKYEFAKDTPIEIAIQEILKDDMQYVRAVTRVADNDKEVIKAVFDDATENEYEFEEGYSADKYCIYVERVAVIRDAPRAQVIDAEDIAVCIDSELDVQRADHIIERYWVTMSEIKLLRSNGVFVATDEELEELERLTRPDLDTDDNTLDVKQARESVSGQSIVYREGGPARLSLLDAYIRKDINDDGIDEDVIVTVVEGKSDIILRYVRLEDVFKHGMRPYIAFHYAPVPGTFWSQGLPQILRELQQEINVIHNQRIDFGTLTNTPWGVYGPMAGFPHEKVVLRPGDWVPVEDPNAIKWFTQGSTQSWAFNEENTVWSIAERLTKVSDLAMGRIGDTQGAARTASGVQSLQAAQSAGFDVIIRRFQDSMRQLLRQLIALYAQYTPEGKEYRILGSKDEPPTVVTRDDITGRLDLVFSGNALSTDREAQRNAATFFAQTVMGPNTLPMLMQLGIMSPVSIAYWFRYLFEVFDVPHLERMILMPAQQIPREPAEILDMLVSGESPIPIDGENHAAVMAMIQEFLNSEKAYSVNAEVRIHMMLHMQERQQKMQLEMQMMMQQQMMQMRQQQMMGPAQQPAGPPQAQPLPPEQPPPQPGVPL